MKSLSSAVLTHLKNMITWVDNSRNTLLSLMNRNNCWNISLWSSFRALPFSLSLKLVFFWFVGQRWDRGCSVPAALSQGCWRDLCLVGLWLRGAGRDRLPLWWLVPWSRGLIWISQPVVEQDIPQRTDYWSSKASTRIKSWGIQIWYEVNDCLILSLTHQCP